MLRFVLIVGMLLGVWHTAYATHIVGGEITYRCLGNDQYEIKLIVFRDCYNGQPPFDAPASIGIFNADWDLVGEVLLPPIGNDTIPIILSNPCLSIPPNVCVHRTMYQTVVNLPFSPGGYTLTYQRCCRNQLIRNIVAPLATGASYIATISEETLLQCNSGAVFNNWPPVAICVNQPIDFDHGATDPDGDSLVYRLCTPLTGASENQPMPQPPNPGPYQEVTWDNPYDLTNVLGGDPLTIDPATGFLTGVPNMIGNYVVGVCVDEYRNDTLISTTRRDFQYNVADCGQPVSAFFVPEVICDTLAVSFLNQSSSALSFEWYFDFDNNPGLSSPAFQPTHTYPDTGLYHIVLIARSDTAICQDTASTYLHLTRSTAAADLEYDFSACSGDTLTVQAIDQSTDPVHGIVGWRWVLKNPIGVVTVDTTQNPTFTVTEPGIYQVVLTVTAGNGCTETINLSFEPPIPDLSELDAEYVICPGDTVALFPDANPDLQYTWTPSNYLSSATAPNPLASPPSTQSYHVVQSGDGPCTAEGDILVTVIDPGMLSATADPSTIIEGDTTQLQLIASSGAASISWTPTAGLSDASSASPLAYPDTTTTYTAEVTLSSGCQLTTAVTVTVLPLGCDEPFVFFPNAFSPNGDGENDYLKLESNVAATVYWAVYNRWGEKVFEARSLDDRWDGTYRGEEQPVETYGYYLEVLCLGGTELRKKGNITLLR